MVFLPTVITAIGRWGDTMTQAIEWLQEVRKLDKPLIDHMGIKERQHPQIGTVIEFPYKQDGKAYAAKFRAIEKKEWRSTQGVSRNLYNEDCLNETGPVVITEGELDALVCIQSGFTKTVSLPDGWTEDGDKRDCLIKETARLKNSDYVIVAGDNDAAGRSLPKAVANILLGHDVRYVTWPENCKDANDVLIQYGEGMVSRLLNEAKKCDPEGGFITGISDLPPLPDRRVLRCQMKPYDYAIAFEVGAMSVGTGVPGSGKSTFTTFAAYQIAKAENIAVGFLSFETHPYQLRDQLCRLETRKPWDELSEESQVQTSAILDSYFKIVHRDYDGNARHNLGWLHDTIYTLAVRDNCKLIIIDPWNELEHMPEKGESLTNYINFALQQLRTWASRFDCHICLIAHPKKMNTEYGNKPPLGYDVSDSAAFYNKPALGFTVHQDTDENNIDHVRVITWKVRNTQLYGFAKGQIKLLFDAGQMSYIPLRNGE